MTRKVFVSILIIYTSLLSQEDYYPPESFYGGGVGFSQMFLFQNLGQLKSFEMLGGKNSFGFNLTKFSSPFIIYGGEGFSNITERIRIGGFVGTNSIFRTKNTQQLPVRNRQFSYRTELLLKMLKWFIYYFTSIF